MSGNDELHEEGTSSTRDAPLMELMEEVAARVQRGESIDLNDYGRRFPEYAERLSGWVAAMAALAGLDDTLQSYPGSERCAEFSDEEITGVLGDFRIVREIGRGGMGVVYEAEQVSLGRRVALKVLPLAAMLDKQQLARFKNEARAAATLDHPNIVAVYSVGSERGIHYFAMQLVEGRSLAEWIEVRKGESGTVRDDDKSQRRKAIPQTDTHAVAAASTVPGYTSRDHYRAFARLGIQAAEALEHAHQHGILHRDIKPANLLVDDAGKLWISDFGLARIEAEAGLTRSGDVLGTIRYMSPEQALGKREVVDFRSDIYSLGASLYELLLLRPAFTESDRSILLNQIAHEDPPLPRHVDRRVPVDLATIVGKAMEKNPEERYQSARQIRDDLQAFLAHRPINARPPTILNRATKWSRRHVAVLWSAAVISLILVIALVISTMSITSSLNQVRLALGQVAQERDAGYQSLYVAQVRLAQLCWDRGDVTRMQDLLDDQLPRPGRADLRGWEWYYLQSLPNREAVAFRGHVPGRVPTGPTSVAWSPDGRRIASTAFDSQEGICQIKLWDPNSGIEIRTLRQSDPVLSVSWSPDGHCLATTSGSGVSLWDIRTGRKLLAFVSGFVDGILISCDTVDNVNHSWSPDGTRIATGCSDRSVVIWDAKTGQALQRLVGYQGDIRLTAWSPDGRSIAATGYELVSITIWNVATGKIRSTLTPAGRGIFGGLVWSPDSSRIVSGSESGIVTEWEVTSGRELRSLSTSSAVQQVAFSLDGRHLAGASGNCVTVWNATTGDIERTIKGHDREVTSIAYSPDGKRLVTGAMDGLVKVWNVERDGSILSREPVALDSVVWSPDDHWLAHGSVNKSIVIRDANTGRRVHVLPGNASLNLKGLCWSHDGHYLACPSDVGLIQVWDVIEGTSLHIWRQDGRPVLSASSTEYVAISWRPHGHQLASMSDVDKRVRIWDARTVELLDSFPLVQVRTGYDSALAWSPDGGRLATVTLNDGVRIWGADGWRSRHIAPVESQLPAWSIAWSADSRCLATAGSSKSPIRIFDSATGMTKTSIVGQANSSQARGMLAWGQDGRRLMTCDTDGTRIWDAVTGDQLLTFEGRTAAAWSHDSKRIAVISGGDIQIHDASPGYRHASDSSYRRFQTQEVSARGLELADKGHEAQALGRLEAALTMSPDDPIVQARMAWFLATCADQRLRDNDRALGLLKNLRAGMKGNAESRRLDPWMQVRQWDAVTIQMALVLAEDDPIVQCRSAWFLTTCADERLRDASRALQLARKLTESLPNFSTGWQVLGWAHYRGGDWAACVAALEKSVRLQGDGGDPWQWYFLAMANQRLGNHELARQWFDKSVHWEKPLTVDQSDEFSRFKNEAESVLGAPAGAPGRR